VLKKLFTALAGASILALQSGNVWAATHGPKALKRGVVTVTTTITGPAISCKKWGPIVVALRVKKTTSIVGGHKTVKIKILDATTPTYPDHTPRSVYINAQALPLLKQEVLQLQSGNLEVISGATDTTVSYKQSLQAAILQAKRP
jgi:hypothetical protein